METDEDVAPMDGLRIVQFTPPGSGCSVAFGEGMTTARPGSAEGTLVVTDIELAHKELVGTGVDVLDLWHGPPFPVTARAARPGPRARQLRLLLLLQRSRRQHLARPRKSPPAVRAGSEGPVEFLADMRTYVPEGTPGSEVDDTKAREAARAGELAARGHLLRLWKPPVEPGEWRSIGLWRADDENELHELLTTLPLHAWMKVEVSPSPHTPTIPEARTRQFLSRCW